MGERVEVVHLGVLRLLQPAMPEDVVDGEQAEAAP
jgi:hypothetical protein